MHNIIIKPQYFQAASEKVNKYELQTSKHGASHESFQIGAY